MNPKYFSRWNDIDKEAKKLCCKETLTVFMPTDSKNNVFITTNQNNEHSFSIEFESLFIKSYCPPQVNGVDIKILQNNNLDKTKTYLVVINVDNKKDEAFIVFAASIFSKLENTTSDIDALEAFEKVIGDFHDFFKFKRALSKIEEQGLVAELLFLNNLISKYGEQAISFWYGCEKNKRDFIVNDISVEIKSTLNQKQDIIHISNENQLSLFDLKKLYLKLYVFDENETGTSVTKCIHETYEMLQSAEYKKLFLMKLMLQQIDPLTYESKYIFSVEIIKTYIVDDSFPKLVKECIPSNVFDVDYYINISGIKAVESAQI